MTGARRLPGVGILLLLIALCGCSEVEEAPSVGYVPATLHAVDGTDFKRVTLTAEGADRTGLRTATVRRRGAHRVVPYAALLYDSAGRSFVYTSPQRLTFLRADVEIAHIDGNRVLLSAGPPPGTVVVTVGASEVYGAELEIAGGH
jgi:hypothetical protein